MSGIVINGERFSPLITAAQIREETKRLAEKINKELAGLDVIFIVVLNGAFVFAADLLRYLDFQPEITFIRVGSYEKMSGSGNLKTIMGLKENINKRTVVVVEDIIDSGNTIEGIVSMLRESNPADIKIAALLLKPHAYSKSIIPDYVAFRIPDDFVIGYGLDYDGYGRNLPDIYVHEQLAE